MPDVLYECETWSLTLREKRRLSVIWNRVMGRIFGPKWDEVTGGGGAGKKIIRVIFIFQKPKKK
jgi:hypothetical protein